MATMTVGDAIYRRLLVRRKFYKRILIIIITFIISFYVSTLLFGDQTVPVVMHLTDLHRCPACYGVSLCPELYSGKILFENMNHWDRLFNAKNIYYGYTNSNRRLVLKKLAHNSELDDFDGKLCTNWGLKINCKPMHLLNVPNINEKIVDLVHYNLTVPSVEPRKGLIMCPNASSIFDFLKPTFNKYLNKKLPNSDMINIWTMLKINPEPLILQIIPRSKNWPVPVYAGVCGRLEVVTYEGEPLASLKHIPWKRKLNHALKIIEAALDFTFKHERFRFYLLDWSLDNIVADGNDEISFVDLEDLVVLDRHVKPSELSDWYTEYTREDYGSEFTFSIDKLCKHHLSDHNLWAACYVLAANDYHHTAYLYPFPEKVYKFALEMDTLLHQCLNGENKLETIHKLQKSMRDVLNNYFEFAL